MHGTARERLRRPAAAALTTVLLIAVALIGPAVADRARGVPPAPPAADARSRVGRP